MKRIINKIPALVSVDWLAENLDAQNLVILDATMPKVGAGEEQPQNLRIPGAMYMDLKNKWCKSEAAFPNTMLDGPEFEQRARALGVNKDSVVVVYDDHGIYSSPRAWWMFRSMGHQQVAVLDGGLPAWIREGHQTEEKGEQSTAEGNFCAEPVSGYFVDQHEVLARIGDGSFVVLDARAEQRFSGATEEPRPGLRSGHIPGSANIPYTALLADGKMKEAEELQRIFDQKRGKAENLIFSCGSGITACVLALGAELSGSDKMAVYDGSWTEWGSLEHLPVEKS